MEVAYVLRNDGIENIGFYMCMHGIFQGSSLPIGSSLFFCVDQCIICGIYIGVIQLFYHWVE